MTGLSSKLDLDGERSQVSACDAINLTGQIFSRLGCDNDIALQVARHLADSSLCGVESHGLMRTLQYVEQFECGYMVASARPRTVKNDRGVLEIDGQQGIGIPAMSLAVDTMREQVAESGVGVLPIRNVGHTGRLGEFAEAAADTGLLTITMGGGNRHIWRQVAPHGGRKAMLPTNPWCIGIPGGARGPVVLDFATSRIAGGWIYAARSAAAKLPADCVIDSDGNPTTDPEDYFNGGAILPAGGAKGYALALMAELIAEALLGPVTTEANWLMIALDTRRYRDASPMQSISEEILSELRDSPPAPGFASVEIPGERERDHREAAQEIIQVPVKTWEQIQALHERLCRDSD